MSADKPSARDRLGRGSPITQPSAAQATSTSPVRVKPYRLTVDLEPADYERLRSWAHEHRATHTGVLRALVRLLDDPSVAQQVRNSVSP